jgi:glycosyltransferase involved in cell wall biosynthesis
MNWPMIAGAGLAAVWTWFTVSAAVGMPTLAELTDRHWDVSPSEIQSRTTGARPPRASIVVPARNEAHTIRPAMQSLMQCDYPQVEVIAVNDRSTDATGGILDEIAKDNPGKLKVVHVTELPQGWLGKTHAMYSAVLQAQGEWILFTDADVSMTPDVVRRAIAYAESTKADHLVVMPTMLTHSWGERMMIALFQAVFIFAQRPWKVRDPKAHDFIGVGAFNLIRRVAYDGVGGYEKLRLAVVDDMKLGEMVKKCGYASDCAFAKNAVQIHWASGAFGMVHNLVKNFFAAMRYNVAIVLIGVFGMLAIYLGPWVGAVVATGWTKTGYLISLLCILCVYLGMAKRSGVNPSYFLLQPAAALLLAYSMLLSAFLAIWRGGVLWRGTMYSLKELRRSGH